MIYLYYIILVLLSLPLEILARLLSPVLPLFAANSYGWLDNHCYQGYGPRLPTWLNWFMTPDNSLDGDSTFERLNGRSYWSQVKWLWRNPLYAYGIQYIKGEEGAYVGDPAIKDNDNAKAGWCFVKAQGLFQFRYVKKIPFIAQCIYINFGWNIMALVDKNVNPKPNPYQATFVFSPRKSGFR